MSLLQIRMLCSCLGLAAVVPACASEAGPDLEGSLQAIESFEPQAGDGDGDDDESVDDEEVGPTPFVSIKAPTGSRDYMAPEAVEYRVVAFDADLPVIDFGLGLSNADGDGRILPHRSSAGELSGYLRDLEPGHYTLNAQAITELFDSHHMEALGEDRRPFRVVALPKGPHGEQPAVTLTYVADWIDNCNRVTLKYTPTDANVRIVKAEYFREGVPYGRVMWDERASFTAQVRVTDDRGYVATASTRVTPRPNRSNPRCPG
jgi:hypothetical protein